jgi:hypothetical protein
VCSVIIYFLYESRICRVMSRDGKCDGFILSSSEVVMLGDGLSC